VLLLHRLIREAITRSASAGTGWVTALQHEAADDSVKNGAVVKAFLREIHEVIDCVRSILNVELHLHLTMIGLERGGICLVRLKCHVKWLGPLLGHILPFRFASGRF